MTDAAKLGPWFPAPWRVEEDWTAEIIAANGKLVMKLPYPQNLAEAHAIVEAVNAAVDIAREKAKPEPEPEPEPEDKDHD